MKKLIALVILAVTGFYLWHSASFGHWVYANISDAEASIYGFEQRSVSIGDMQLALYIGGPDKATNSANGKPAETIVMLHGFSADKDVWPRFAKHFIDDYQVVIPDLAGHGDSAYNANWDYSAPAQAKRVAALLDALDIPQAHIMGNSMGGLITAWFARLYPERTLSAAPMDPAGITSPQRSKMETMIAEGNNPFFIENRDEFDRFYAMTMAKPPYLPNFILEAVAENYQTRRPELQKIEADFANKNLLTDELQHIQTPSLIIWGAEDEILDPSAAPIWQAKLPNAQSHIFTGIGHMPMVEIPTESAKVYRDFLNSLPR